MCGLNLAGVTSEMGEAIWEHFVAVSRTLMKWKLRDGACSAPSIECSPLLCREGGASCLRRHALQVMKMSQRFLIMFFASQILFTGRYWP